MGNKFEQIDRKSPELRKETSYIPLGQNQKEALEEVRSKFGLPDFFESIYDDSVKVLRDLTRPLKNVPLFQPPSIIFIHRDAVKRMTGSFFEHSDRENVKDSIFTYSPINYTVYLSIEDLQKISPEELREVLLEEFIHGATTRYTRDKVLNAGIIKLDIPSDKFPTGGFFRFEERDVIENFEEDSEERLSEGAKEVALTETLTRLLVMFCNSDVESIFSLKSSREVSQISDPQIAQHKLKENMLAFNLELKDLLKAFNQLTKNNLKKVLFLGLRNGDSSQLAQQLMNFNMEKLESLPENKKIALLQTIKLLRGILEEAYQGREVSIFATPPQK